MKNLNSYIDRHNTLDQRQATLNQARNEFCRDLRAEFANGKPGDLQFQSWCEINLKVATIVARDYLLRASAGAVFKNEAELRAVGGLSALTLIADKSSIEQKKILLQAQAQKVKIRDLVKPGAATTGTTRRSKYDHLKALAEFVLGSKDAPTQLRKVAALYASAPAVPQGTRRASARA